MVFKKINQNVIKFDGVNDRIEVGNRPANSNLSFGQPGATEKPFSISAWIFVIDVSEDESASHIAGISNNAAAFYEYIFARRDGTEIVFYLYDIGAQGQHGGSCRLQSITTDSRLQDSTWHHVVGTYDGSKSENGLKIYVDGLESQILRSNNNGGDYVQMRNEMRPFTIGGYASNAGFFEDRMADVCIFDKELTAAEVAEIYNSGQVKDMTKATTYNNLISWWKMGDDQDNSGPLGVKDYKGLNHGTLKNGASILLDTLIASDSLPIYGTKFFVPKGYGKVRRPKSLLTDKISRVNFGEYFDVVNGNNPLGSTYHEDGNVYRDINGEQTLISYDTENERYLHLTLDLQNYSHHPGIVLIAPWFWYKGNKRFFRAAPLGNPHERPGLDDVGVPGNPSGDSQPNMETDFSHLWVSPGEIGHRVIDLYGADKVFFQVFGLQPNAVTIESLGDAGNGFIEVNDIHLYASLSTF